MKNIVNHLKTAVMGLALTAIVSTSVFSQVLKIGFINDERIKQEFKAWQKAQEQFEVEAKAWDEEAAQKQTEYENLTAEYEKQKLILSDEKKKEREAALKVKRDDLENFTKRIFGPGGEAERKHQQLLEPLLESVNKAIEAVAIETNFDVIFTLQSGLGYIKPTFDITDKVLKYLEENVQ